MIEDAGFTVLAVGYKSVWRIADNRIAACRKPAAPPASAAVEAGSEPELAGAAAPA